MCSDLRRLRKHGMPQPHYGPYDSFFTMVVHHGGKIVNPSFICLFRGDYTKVYSYGNVNYFDYCNADLMSMLELHDMMHELYIEGSVRFHMKVIEDVWEKVETDAQLLKLIAKLPQNKLVDLYVEHVGGAKGKVHEDLFVEEDVVHEHRDAAQEDVVHEEDAATDVVHEGEDVVQEDAEKLQEDVVEDKTELEDVADTDSDESTDLDQFEDSDYENDDAMFRESIDKDAEWAGIEIGVGGKAVDFKACGKDVNNEANEADVSEDEAYDSEALNSLSSSDEEGKVKRQKHKWDVFNAKTDMVDPTFKIGMLFSSSTELNHAIRKYAIKNRKQIKIKKCESNRVRAVCRQGCNWMLFGSKMQDCDTLQIKTHNPVHSCHRSFENDNVSAKWLAKEYLSQIRANPGWPLSAFHEQVMADWQVSASVGKLFRAKSIVFSMINGTIAEQYGRLHDYIAALKEADPDTTVVMQGEGLGARRFQRIYICLGSCKKGFLQNCRPIIGMDGCHLKGCNGGQILAAVGLDGNNSMFLICYAVVEKENTSSWMWFIKLLQEDINFGNSHAWTFITDKQKGLVHALETLCPNSEIRFCVRHLYDNFKAENKGLALKNQLYTCARATAVAEFEKEMKVLHEMDEKAFTWLAKKPPQQWSRSHFQTWCKSDMLLNNLSESFNNMMKHARDKPIITMLERIRSILMKRMHVNLDKMNKSGGPLCNKIHEILEKTKKEASFCVPEFAGGAKFQVKGPGGQFKCDLNQMTCDCKKWELTGLPCKHGISAMAYCGIEAETCVGHWYSKETYLKLYSNFIKPLSGPDMWPKTGKEPMLPPDYNKPLGRPTTNRRRGLDEKKSTNPNKLGKRYQVSLKCSKCKQFGHNKRSCTQQRKTYGTSSAATAKAQTLERNAKKVGEASTQPPQKTRKTAAKKVGEASTQPPQKTRKTAAKKVGEASTQPPQKTRKTAAKKVGEASTQPPQKKRKTAPPGSSTQP